MGGPRRAARRGGAVVPILKRECTRLARSLQKATADFDAKSKAITAALAVQWGFRPGGEADSFHIGRSQSALSKELGAAAAKADLARIRFSNRCLPGTGQILFFSRK